MSRLSLIDLAGSEQATSQMERRSEGAFINKRCVVSLSPTCCRTNPDTLALHAAC